MAFKTRHMPGKHRVIEDQGARRVRHQVLPVLPGRVADRGRDNAEIFSVTGIGEDIEHPVRLIDTVFVAGLPRLDQTRRRQRLFGRDQPAFRRLMVMAVDNDPVAGLALADAHEKAGVGFFVHQHVIGDRAADFMAEEL